MFAGARTIRLTAAAATIVASIVVVADEPVAAACADQNVATAAELVAAVTVANGCDGPETIFLAAGDYDRVTLTITDDLTLQGAGRTLTRLGQDGIFGFNVQNEILIVADASLTVRDLGLRELDPGKLTMIDATDATVDVARVDVDGVDQTQLFADGGGIIALRSDLVVTDTTMTWLDGWGIDVTDGSLTASGLTVGNTYSSGIVSSNGPVSIDGSTVAVTGWGNSSGDNVTITNAVPLTITDTQIRSSQDNLLEIFSSPGAVIDGVTLGKPTSTPAEIGLRIISSTGTTVVDTTVENVGVGVATGSPTSFTGVTIRDSVTGLQIGNPGEYAFTATTIAGNGTDCAFTGAPTIVDNGGNLDGDGTCGFEENLPPVAVDDAFGVGATEIAELAVLANDSDPNDDLLTLTSILTPAGNGSASIEPGGELITYLADDGFVGTDTFVYEVTDGLDVATATVTIDVLPEIRIADGDVAEGDGGSTLVLPITVTPPSIDAVTFDIAFVGGTATPGVDYDDQLQSFFVSTGTTGTELEIPILGDDVVEDDETIEVQIVDPEGALIADGNAVGEIQDDDDAAVGFAPFSDHFEDAGDLVLTVELSDPAAIPVAVDWATIAPPPGNDPVATPGEDYVEVGGTATFAAGSTSTTLTVPIIDDDAGEPDERFAVDLTSTSDPRVAIDPGAATAIVTIADDDAPIGVQAWIDPIEVDETAGEVTTDVAIDVPLPFDVQIEWTLQDGIATVGDDIAIAGATTTIVAGTTRTPITLTVLDDAEWEGAENAELAIVATSGPLAPTGATFSVWIDDREDAGTIAVADVEVNEGDGVAVVSMDLSRPNANPFDVSYTTTARTATEGADYVSSSTPFTFPAGATESSVAFEIVDDDIAEAVESFDVVFESSDAHADQPGWAPGDVLTTVTIVDDDGGSSASIGGADGPGTVDVAETDPFVPLEITVEPPLSVDVEIDWEVAAGALPGVRAATIGDDVADASGTVTIPAGTTTASISVPLLDDSVSEGREMFVVQLVFASEAEVDLTGAIAMVVIDDPEDAPTLSATDATVGEFEGEAIVELGLSAPSAQPITLTVALADGTATDADYGPLSTATVDLPAGASGTAVEVPIADDVLVELDETFSLAFLSSEPPLAGPAPGTTIATVTIIDDDTDPPGPPAEDPPPPDDPPVDDGPTAGAVGRDLFSHLDELCPTLREWFAETVPVEAYPTIDEYFDFDVEGCLPELKDQDLGDLSWDELVEWIEEVAGGVVTSFDGGRRSPPVATPDTIELRQGTTVEQVDVTANDYDEAQRPLHVPGHTTDVAGLSDVTITREGIATIAAEPDFVGTATVTYSLCTPDSCTATQITVIVSADPPQPRLTPDHASVNAGEARGGLGEPAAPNALVNDRPRGVIVDGQGVNLTLAGVTPGDATVYSGHSSNGAVQLDATDNLPVTSTQQELTYEACLVTGNCASSTLTIYLNGTDAPQVSDDRLNVGHSNRARADVELNDAEVGIIVETIVPADQIGIAAATVAAAGDVVDIEVEPWFTGPAQVLYRTCFNVSGTPTVPDLDRCSTGVITVWRVDRYGPTANDDRFELPTNAFFTTGVLDVLGGTAQGADHATGPIVFLSPPPPDVGSTQPGIPFTAVGTDGQPFQPGEVRTDGTSLVLWKQVDDPTDIELPQPGTTSTFEYTICDTPPAGHGPAWEPLCDAATVTIEWTKPIGVTVDSRTVVVPVVRTSAEGVPTEQETWVVATGGIGVASRALISVPAQLPAIGAIQLNSEVTVPLDDLFSASVAAQYGTVSPTTTPGVYDFVPSDPNPAKHPRGIEIAVTATDFTSSASGTITVRFVEFDYHTIVTTSVVSGPTEIDLFEGDLVTPEGVDATETRIAGVAGVPADRLPVIVPGGTIELVDDRKVRFVPDPGTDGVVSIPYETCRTLAGTYDATAYSDEQCASGGAIVRIIDPVGGATGFGSGGSRGMSADAIRLLSRPRFPFDPDTDTYLEVRFERGLSELLEDPDHTGSDINETTTTVLDGLVDVFGLDAAVVWSADVDVLLVAGLDPDGFYLDGESGITIRVRGGGSLAGVRQIAGVDVLTSASAGGDLVVEIGPDQPGTRLRDLGDLGSVLATRYDGVATVAAGLRAGPVEAWPTLAIDIGGGGTAPTATTTVAVPVTITLPGTDDGTGAPAFIRLFGQMVGDELRIVGDAEIPPGSVIDGFGLSDIVVDAALTPETLTGTIDGRLDIEALGISIPVTVAFDRSAISVDAAVPLGSAVLPPEVAQYLALSADAEVTVDLDGDVEAGTIGGSVSLSAGAIEVLEGSALGSATATGLTGIIRADGTADLTAAGITGTALGHELIGTAGNVRIGYGPEVPVIELREIQAIDPSGIEVTLGRVRFYRDGRVEIDAGCVAADAGLGDAIGIGGLLPFDITETCIDGDAVEVTGYFDFSRLEPLPFTPSLTIDTGGGTTLVTETDATNTFTFRFDLGTLQPIDVGTITVGFDDLTVDGLTGSGSISITNDDDGYVFGGDLTFAALLGGGGGSATGSLGGTFDPASGSVALDVALTASGELAGLATLRPSTLVFTLEVAIDENGDLTVGGPALVGLDLEGCLHLPGITNMAPVWCLDGITVGASFATGIWTLSARSDLAAGTEFVGLEFVGLNGTVTIDLTGPSPEVSSNIGADAITGRLAGLFELTTDAVTLNIDTFSVTPILEPIPSITASVLDDAGNSVLEGVINGLTITNDGTIELDGISVTANLDTMDVADVLPVDTVVVDISLPDGADGAFADQYVVRVSGRFDLSALDAFDPFVTIGAAATCQNPPAGSTFGPIEIAVDSLAEGRFRLLDAGPIAVGLCNVEVGPVTFGGSIGLGGYQDGVLVPTIAGELLASGDVDGFAAAGGIAVSGTFGTDGDTTTLDLSGSVIASVTVDGIIELDNATFDFAVGLRYDPAATPPLSIVGGGLASGIVADRFAIDIGGVLGVELDDPELLPEPGVLFRIDSDDPDAGATVHVGGLPDGGAGGPAGPLDGWRGTINHFEVANDGAVYLLPGFSVDLGSDGPTGLPEWLPFDVTRAGLWFPLADDGDPDNGFEGGTTFDTDITETVALEDLVDDLTDIGIVFSGGVTADPELFPIGFEVDDLRIDIGLLKDWLESLASGEAPTTDFPVVGLAGISVGVEPFDIGPVTIGGALTIGLLDNPGAAPAFYLRVVGEFAYGDLGLGVDLVVAENGPVLAEWKAPAGIVFGQTGIMLSGVRGGIDFRGLFEPISIECEGRPDGSVECNEGALDLLGNPAFDIGDFTITPPAIRQAVAAKQAAIDAGEAEIWPTAFGLKVGGTVTHVATPGIIEGALDFAVYADLADPGLQMVGSGEVTVYGLPMGEAVVFVDYAEPLDPVFSIAFGMPTPNGGPLDLLVPAQLEYGGALDTEGLSAAMILGVRELAIRVIDGALESPQANAVFGAALDQLLARLDANHELELAQLLLGGSDAVIDRAFFEARIAELLPSADELLVVQPDGSVVLDPTADVQLAIVVAAALVRDLLADAGFLAEPPPTVPPFTGEQLTATALDVTRSVFADSGEIGDLVQRIADPTLLVNGKIQLELFDIPLGEPQQETLLFIDKEQLFFGMDGSIKRTISLLGGWCPACHIAAEVVTLGIEDQTTVGVSVPIDFSWLTDTTNPDWPELPPFDPWQNDWTANVEGTIYVVGFPTAGATGVVAPLGQSEQLIANILADVADLDARQRGVDLVTDTGGVWVRGGLQVPEALSDPLGWFDDMKAALGGGLPENPLDWPEAITSVVDTATAARELGALEFYLPAPTDQVLMQSLDGLGDLDTDDPRAVQLADEFDTAYLQASLGADLLGYRVSSIDIAIEGPGDTYEAEIAFPFFGEPLTALIESVRLDGGADPDDPVYWPALGVDQTITSDQVRDLLAEVGMDDILPRDIDDGSVRFRAYTPLHHLTAADPASAAAADPLRVSGGIELTVVGTHREHGAVTATIAIAPGEVDGDGIGIRDLLPGSVDVTVTLGTLTVGGVTVQPATLTGSLDSTGDFSIAVDGTASIDGWSGTATFVGELTDSGFGGTLDLGSGLTRDGLTVAGTVDVTAEPTGFTVTLTNASITAGGLFGPISASGTISDAGIDISVTGRSFDLGPVEIACATVDVLLNGGAVQLGVDGVATVPGVTEPGVPGSPGGGGKPVGCTADGIAVDGTIDADGFGSLTLRADRFLVGGLTVNDADLTLVRTPASTRISIDATVDTLATTFTGTGWVTISPAGASGSITLDARGTPKVGGNLGWPFAGTVTLTFGGGTHGIGVEGSVAPFGAGAIAVAGTADTTGGFDLTVTSENVAVGPMTIDGQIELRRTATGLVELSVTGAVVDIAGLTRASVPRFELDSLGGFDVTLTVDRIGNDDLAIVGSSLQMQRRGSGGIDVDLHGGSLLIGVDGAAGIPLPDLAFRIPAPAASELTFDETITIPDVVLGPAFAFGGGEATIEFEGGELSFALLDDVSLDALAGSVGMQVTDLTISSDGSLSGAADGKLRVYGQTIADADFTLSRQSGAIRLTIDAPAALSLPPFLNLSVAGWAQSDGTYRFTSAISGADDDGPIGAWSYTGIVTIENDGGGVSGRFAGTASALGIVSGSASGTVYANGVMVLRVTGDLFGVQSTRTLTLPPGARPPRTSNDAPVFGNLPAGGVMVANVATIAPPTTVVHYADLLDLTVSGAETIACSPASGGLFPVDAVTQISCSAVNDGGTATITFDLDVRRAAGTVSVSSPTVGGTPTLPIGADIPVGGVADPGTPGRIVIHSTPLELATFTVGPDGRWSTVVRVPTTVPSGRHTLVVESIVDGRVTLTHVDVLVQPVGTLPRTGADTRTLLRAALLLVALGLLLRVRSTRWALRRW